MPARVSTTDRVHSQLREEIVSGELTGGSLHSIYGLADRLNVSRTPVRDAVLRLADAGMVTIERNRGVRIRGIGVHDIREVFEARLLLEVPTAAHAARFGSDELLHQLDERVKGLTGAVQQHDEREFVRLDRELHRAIVLSAGNERLADLVESLRDTTQAYGVSTIDRSRSIREVHVEHVPIVDAIRARDADAAASLMRDHLTTTALLLMRQVAASTGEATPDAWPSRFAP
ncbi:GntR family transcriptional regulator [Microbacterium sp.]|uniref:GntR family transcriptional regulator n=1 Tax=Microbacterium sp. TaxID=51671 RepID=UPI0028ADE2F5|nr:GntR family transcriptional regulator [Microbacterium sp.]